MKKILITGKSSYIGNKFEEWLSKWPDEYEIYTISLRDESWKKNDFSIYDAVYHVVGIAHRKETDENRELYYTINRDLTYEIAKKSKHDGAKQFIFLSTMSVYGLETGIIGEDTPLKPNNAYGKSKLEAEALVQSLEEESFKTAIIRPPMVYGKGCKGNYQRLSKLALKTPIFPDIHNKRSMIYIDNLSEFVRLLVDNCSDGLFFPQNSEYVNTTEMVRLIAEVHNRKIIMTKLFNPLIRLLNVNVLNKVFGDLIYKRDIMQDKNEHIVVQFKNSIIQTEGK